MGLDAVVYAGIPEQVEVERGSEDAEVKALDPRPQEVIAMHKRLGNASMIASLAGEIRPFIENDSLLLSKVLYSGSHSGDEIRVQDIDRLDSEIKSTRAMSGDSLSKALENFLKDMSDLVEKAKEQGRPIVFT